MVEPRRQLRRIAIALGLLLTAACGHRRAHDLAGGWAGTWTRDGDPLTVTSVSQPADSGGQAIVFSREKIQFSPAPLVDEEGQPSS